MLNEFVWHEEQPALPVEVRGKDVDLMIRDLYDELMRVRMGELVNVWCKAELSWHVARARYGKESPLFRTDILSCVVDLYFDALSSVGRIGWYNVVQVGDGAKLESIVVFGYETDADVISDIRDLDEEASSESASSSEEAFAEPPRKKSFVELIREMM